MRARVLTVSTRAAAGVYPDRGGPVLVEGLRALGFAVEGPRVVPDGPRVEEELRAAVDDGVDVLLTTGGTIRGACRPLVSHVASHRISHRSWRRRGRR